MINPLRRLVLSLAKVSLQPHPPFGAPESLRVFRAAPNHYRVRLVRWFFAQLLTAVGILLSLGFIADVKQRIAERNGEPVAYSSFDEGVRRFQESMTKVTGGRFFDPRDPAAEQVAQVAPNWVLPVLIIGEAIGIAVYLLQLPLTFAALRLDYELRWYMVTDRSLRIRAGIWKVQETTMSFANLQQVEVRQGPLQRVLGIADVRVRSAGGGGGSATQSHQKAAEDSLHEGVFQGVDNAHQIRDLIVERLRIFREAGLGDPEDQAIRAEAAHVVSVPHSSELQAVQEVLAEARALRAQLTGGRNA